MEWKPLTRPALLVMRLALATTPAAAEVIPIDAGGGRNVLAQVANTIEADAMSRPAPALSDRLDERLAAIEREAARLGRSGDVASAERFRTELRQFRARRDGEAGAGGDTPELHVVGVYEGAKPKKGNDDAGTAVVDLAVLDRPVVLVLCAYETVRWDVRVAPGVRLERVIVGGYERQEVNGAPEGVPVGTHTARDDADGYFYAYRRDDERYAPLARRLKDLTGLDVSTFQGTYCAGPAPFVLGPANADWSAQRLLGDVEPVYLEAVAYELAQRRAAVRDVRFRAVHWFPDPGPAGRLEWAGALAEFSPGGPIDGTARPLPAGARHAVADPSDGTTYVLGSSDVVRIDAKTGQASKLVPADPNLPELSHPSAIAFDTKRRRLVVATLGGSGHLLAYDPKDDAWSLLAGLDDLDVSALAYAADADCFYALPQQLGDPSAPAPTLVRFTADGKPDLLIRPSERIDLGPRRSPVEPAAQVVAAGGHVAILTPPPSRRGPGRRRVAFGPRPRCVLLDPRTGDVTYAGPIDTRSADTGGVGDGELDALWETLGGADDIAADRAMTRLVAAGDRAVQFIAAELSGPVTTADPAELDALIGQLGQDDPRAREAATRRLRRLGPAAGPTLRAALGSGASPEVVVRIQQLIREAEPQPADARREQAGLLILSRVGTPAAVDVLRRWAIDGKRAEAARGALRAVAKD